MMCAPLAAVGAGVSAAGALMGGVQSMMQGNYEAKVARNNAGLESAAAADSIDRGRDEAQAFYRDIGRTNGDQIAAMAANGIYTGSGTALRLQQDTADLVREDANNLYSKINERTQGNVINAMNFVQAAKAAKWAGSRS